MAGLLLAGVAGAQTEKGNGLISGDVSINHARPGVQSGNADYSWGTGLNITAGRFVADNWLVGATVSGTWGLNNTQSTIAVGQAPRVLTDRGSSVKGYVTPFVRRYWQFSPVQVFAGAGLSVGITNERTDAEKLDPVNQGIISTQLRSSSLSVSPYVEAGVNYFLTNRLSLQLSAASHWLPLDVATIKTGLVYWTGSSRKADPQPVSDYGQTNRGNWIIEGSFLAGGSSGNNSSSNTGSQTSSRSFSFSPSVGYFISKNNLLGIRIPLGLFTYENSGQNPTFSGSGSSWSVGVSPYFQHYWTSTRLTPYTRVSAAYYMSGARPDVSNTKFMNTSAALSVGLAYMAGKRFIIETSLASASVNYSTTSERTSASKPWEASLSAGLSGNFAVRYVLTHPN